MSLRPARDLQGHGPDDHPSDEHELLAAVIRSTPVLVFRLDPADLSFTYVSPNVVEILGYDPDEIVGMPGWWADRLDPGEGGEFLERVGHDLRSGTPRGEYELRFRDRFGRYRWFQVAVALDRFQGRELVGHAIDVTARRQAEEERRAAEARYRTLVDRIPAIVYEAEIGDEAPWRFVSPRIETVLGYSYEEWIANPGLWDRCLHPEDRERVLAEEREAVPLGVFASEYRLRARDGRVVWVADEAEVIPQPEGPALMRGILYDITDRKRIEEGLKQSLVLLQRTDDERRRLLARLVEAQEDERRRIADDIHDDSIQIVTAVGLRLGALERRIDDADLRRSVGQLRETVGSAIARLRGLLFELRPRALDLEGLAATLRIYLDQLREQGGFDASLENRLTQEPEPEVRTVLYRIAQEALINARKHAQARKVEVLLEPREGGFFVRVGDDGRGVSAEELSVPSPGHLGLSAMRERAEMMGGWWRIKGAPGSGTTVEFWLPERPPDAVREPSPRAGQPADPV